MFKVTIKNKSNVIMAQAQFETNTLAQAWVLEQTGHQAWGKPDRWLKPSEFTFETTEDALDSREIVGIRDDKFTEYFFAAEFKVEITDITAQVEFEKRFVKGLSSQQFGASLIAKVYAMNEMKAEAGLLDQAKFMAIMQDQGLALVERLLWNGSIKTAKGLIQQMDTSLFTAAEKNSILSEINTFLASQ